MKSIAPIGMGLAAQLINFGGKHPGAFSFAEQQLQGAVALHNILAKERFAYIADEVGMGKTYVALGMIALMRHFHPDLRVLYLVPRENLQRKWQKEIHNFASNNWQTVDHRVCTFGGTPAREVVECGNLLEFVRAVAFNANRDFLLRMSSFSFGLSDKEERYQEKWAEYRSKVVRELRWLPADQLSLRNKAAFKDSIARAVNAIMPSFDLVVVDEAHNLKHGFGSSTQVSARNRTLALALGHPDEEAGIFNGGGIKADRVLALSATPIETSFRELWNQMDVLCLGNLARELRDEQRDDGQRKDIARRFLVRRVMSLTINGQPHTKNMYRREWRGGGVQAHDESMQLADVSQRLVIALVQKKVAEVLEQTGRKSNGYFSRSFQVGMLSSFESFLQTAKVDKTNPDPTFDQDEQARTSTEKDGIDTPSLQKIARSYEACFNAPMPHPKMDAVAEQLWNWVLKGEKSLIFVRRIASVRELQDKVAQYYDKWVMGYLRVQLAGNSGAMRQLEKCFEDYAEAWRGRRSNRPAPVAHINGETPLCEEIQEDKDEGSADNFFAWFFRGEGPEGVVSGAHFRKIRLGGEGTTLSTFFEDNYIRLALNLAVTDANVFAAWQKACPDVSAEEIRARAFHLFRRSSRQKRFPRRRVFLAYQEAALRFLARQETESGRRARVILEERFPENFSSSFPVPQSFPAVEQFLDPSTFFTGLAQRNTLADELNWKEHEPANDFRAYFRRREQQRELLTSVVTLGHPIVDLWSLAVRRLPSLHRSAAERSDQSSEELARDFLDLLETQRSVPFSSLREIAQVAGNCELIANVNFPGLDTKHLRDLPGFYRSALQRQTPIGGMWGQFNQQLVTQFRMPGYPYVLITTDVVQEGEDLHTFCSRVVHYGITWTPSSMEQRTGRVDRIGSLIHRKLDRAMGVTEGDFLQVFFPYLPDTVEIIQVREIFRRMNRFLNLMHEAMQVSAGGDPTVDVSNGILSAAVPIAANREPLRTSFEISPGLIGKSDVRMPYGTNVSDYSGKFKELVIGAQQVLPLNFHRASETLRAGSIAIDGLDIAKLVPSTTVPAQLKDVEIELSATKRGRVRISVRSLITSIETADHDEISTLISAHRQFGRGKLVAEPTDQDQLRLSAESNILFSTTKTTASELATAIRSAVVCALILRRVIDNRGADAAHS